MMINAIKLVCGALMVLLSVSNTPTDGIKTKAPVMPDTRYNFKYMGIVAMGNSLQPLSGQLSKNGLSLYVTAPDNKGIKRLYKLERTHTGNDFAIPKECTGNIKDGNYDIITPSLSADEKTIVFVQAANGYDGGRDLYIATKDASGQFGSVRNLSEINDTMLSDSYPWLSPDGLRVYFTKQKEGRITFYIASRKTTNDKFSNLHELGFTLPKNYNNTSCVLTNNELDIFALEGDDIYHATRASINSRFSTPKIIATTSAEPLTSINAITLTDDAKELYVFRSTGLRKAEVMRFVNTASDLTLPAPGK